MLCSQHNTFKHAAAIRSPPTMHVVLVDFPSVRNKLQLATVETLAKNTLTFAKCTNQTRPHPCPLFKAFFVRVGFCWILQQVPPPVHLQRRHSLLTSVLLRRLPHLSRFNNHAFSQLGYRNVSLLQLRNKLPVHVLEFWGSPKMSPPGPKTLVIWGRPPGPI